ncbi:uncharacterized protein [Rutidosis leptorrhynchoides]|uniref:uncharacterized protein n=1 Tax=Rutidosis leptorrhynchoides TaxID=125765 RepID=UPI003A9993F6
MNVINVYGPHDNKSKLKMWKSISEILEQDRDGAWALCEYRAKRFNDFISSNNLIDLPLGWILFTRVSDDGSKFRKLDRFLVTERFCDDWINLSAVALERKHSDHCLIILKDDEKNFGPKPFKIFDAWLEEEDIDQVIIDAWKEESSVSNRRDCNFRNKLKKVKEELRKWSNKRYGGLDGEIKLLKESAGALEIKAEIGELNQDRPSLEDLCYRTLSDDQAANLEVAFSVQEIHEAILECGSTKAPGPDGFNMRFFKKHWDIIKTELVDAIMWFWDKEEISRGCNASFVTLIPKKNDPLGLGDFRSISLIGSYYKIISKVLANRLKKVTPTLVGHEQSAYLKDRFILDEALIVNESINFLRAKKHKGIIFKVDFEKAFDCLNWDFLLEVMKCMGFGSK